MALRFFARANSFSRTPSEFQATTRGTASQAMRPLLSRDANLIHASNEYSSSWSSCSPAMSRSVASRGTMYYRGDGPAIPELIAGRVQVMFGSVVTWAQQIKAGTVRPLGVTSATRTQLLPDLPPIGQFVPGYEGIGWQGIGAPKNTPADVIDKLNGAISAGLADPKFNSRFTDLGAEIFAGSPADFGRFIVDYTEKWAKVIRAAGVKAE